MTFYDQPNRESVGVAPLDAATGAAPKEAPTSAVFDPGAHTVAEVLEYLEDHPGEAETVGAAERAGKARSTLLDALEADEV